MTSDFFLMVYVTYKISESYLNCIQTLHLLWSMFFKCSGLDKRTWLSIHASCFFFFPNSKLQDSNSIENCPHICFSVNFIFLWSLVSRQSWWCCEFGNRLNQRIVQNIIFYVGFWTISLIFVSKMLTNYVEE